MKKSVGLAFALILIFTFQVGNVFAATPLNAAVDKQIGVKYQWGGTTEKGFDCSGFTMFIFKQFDVELPHTSRGQALKGTKVEKKNLRPGDLVFFDTGGNGISHVGIYVGDGKFAHASNDGVEISKLSQDYYAKRYVTGRRILSDEAYKKLITDPDKKAETAAVKKADTVTAAK